MLCSSHCQQCSTVGRDGVCKGLFETRFTQVLSEGLFQASAVQEMLSQTSREELGPCLLHMQGFSQDRWQSLRLLPPGHGGSAGESLYPHATKPAARTEHQGDSSLPGCCPSTSALLSPRLLLTFSSLALVYSTNRSLSDREGLGSQMCQGARNREAVTH